MRENASVRWPPPRRLPPRGPLRNTLEAFTGHQPGGIRRTGTRFEAALAAMPTQTVTGMARGGVPHASASAERPRRETTPTPKGVGSLFSRHSWRYRAAITPMRHFRHNL